MLEWNCSFVDLPCAVFLSAFQFFLRFLEREKNQGNYGLVKFFKVGRNLFFDSYSFFTPEEP